MIGMVTAGTPQQLPVTNDRHATMTNATAGSIPGVTCGATDSMINSDIPIAASTFCRVSAEIMIANIRNISANPVMNASEKSLNVILFLTMYITVATTVPITTPVSRSMSKYSVPAISAAIGMMKSHMLAALSGS